MKKISTPPSTASTIPLERPPSGAFGNASKVHNVANHLGNSLLADAPESGPSMQLSVSEVPRVTQPQRSAHGDDIQTFPRGMVLYRGDNSFNPNGPHPYRAQFYTEYPEVAREEYAHGHLVLEMHTNRDLNLIRLDQNPEGLLDWLGAENSLPQEDRDIIHINFGCPRLGSDSTNTSEIKRNRLSQGEKDRKMVELIQAYAQATKQDIHGYYNGVMNKVETRTEKAKEAKPSLFHAEFVVCDPAHIDAPRLLGSYTSEEIYNAHTHDKMVRMGQELAEQRRQKRRRPNIDPPAQPRFHSLDSSSSENSDTQKKYEPSGLFATTFKPAHNSDGADAKSKFLGPKDFLPSDLSRAIAASRAVKVAQLSTTEAQQARLPEGHHWHNPSADGNCLFHALARAFPELGNHEEIRQTLAVAAETTEGFDEEYQQEFVEALSQAGEYTGLADSAIQFASIAFNLNITAIVEDGTDRHFGPGNADAATRPMTLARSQDHFFLMELDQEGQELAPPQAQQGSVQKDPARREARDAGMRGFFDKSPSTGTSRGVESLFPSLNKGSKFSLKPKVQKNSSRGG